MLFALARAIFHGVRLRLRGGAGSEDLRTSIKMQFLQQTLKDVPLSAAQNAAARLKAWRRWNPAIKQALDNHRVQGHLIVVATGALDLYIGALLEDTPVDGVLATSMEVVDGHLTGLLAGDNCVRAAKAQRVADFIAAHGPFTESWGYGNRPSDLPMLALMQNQVIV